MSRVTGAKLVLAATGLMIWGYGINTDTPTVQYVGIATIAAAVLLRFFKRPDPGG